MAQDAKAPKVTISTDGLEAKIFFITPEVGEEKRQYTMTDLRGIVMSAGVTYGIDENELENLAELPIYGREIVVARGVAPIEGTPGDYKYNFDLTVNKKPTIRPDGSTDYMNIKVIETVRSGEVIAEYIPAVQGKPGTSVRGTEIPPKMVRDLPPLAGRGFERSADNMTYTAIIDGKIEMQGPRIIISPVYEITHDADISTGNIDFNGDVVIHGGAKDGVVIKAAGNVTIDGLVESCDIYAGKDLFLLSGVKGGERTKIHANGNITAQFIEYAEVTCGGSATADYIFKCKVICDGKLDLTGKKSAIIGGYVSAVEGIDVNYIGNDFGTITTVAVGITQERYVAIENLKSKIAAIADNVAKIKKGVEEFDRIGQERGVSFKEDPRRIQLLRVKIRDEAVIVEEKAKLEKQEAILNRGKNSTIRVFNTVYAGTSVSIDNHHTEVHDYQRHVAFVKSPEGIRMEVLEGIIETRTNK